MAEDASRLREEISLLKKEILVLNSNKEKLNQVIESLHKEKIEHLKEIPLYEKQAIDAKSATIEPLKELSGLKKNVSDLKNKHLSLQKLIVESNQILDELTTTKARVIKETNDIQEAIKNSHASLIERESSVNEKEKNIFHKEEFHKRVSLSLDKREVEIANKEKELTLKVNDLQKKIDEHNSHVELHGKKVDTLIEQKQFLREDQQILRDKNELANKLIKDNADIKSAMLKQSEKMNDEINKAEAKQVSLDKAILDLKNEEKRIKILELKVLKMVKDANLEKELKDLMESLK